MTSRGGGQRWCPRYNCKLAHSSALNLSWRDIMASSDTSIQTWDWLLWRWLYLKLVWLVGIIIIMCPAIWYRRIFMFLHRSWCLVLLITLVDDIPPCQRFRPFRLVSFGLPMPHLPGCHNVLRRYTNGKKNKFKAVIFPKLPLLTSTWNILSKHLQS